MKLLNKTVWAITPEMLQTMMTIAKQNNKSPEAVASQLGKEMKNTNAVSIRDGVAVIRVTGPLFRYANLFTRICGATSYELFAQDFNKAGVVAKTVVMDPDAWKIFRSNSTVEKYLDYRRGTNNTLNADPITRGKDSKARYVGTIGDFDIYVYNDSYINDAGQTTNLLPSKTVILGSRDGLDGTRCYGAIHDEKANWTATRYFTKSWLEEDPSVRWLLLQSAPLVVPYRPNAVLCATIG